MTTYLLTIRPCVEILAVSPSGSSTLWRSRPALLPSVSHGQSLLSDEIDLIGAASALSTEAMEIVRDWHKQSKWPTFLLLLTSSGIIVYSLYKSSMTDQPRVRKRVKKSRWNSRDWLWWIFGDDEISEDDALQCQQSDYFGPSPTATQMSRTQQFLGKELSPFLAPCPNCARATCKIRKHHLMLAEKNASTIGSSYSNSPQHVTDLPANDKPQKSGLFPPTSTPESADDEASDFEDNFQVYSVRMQKFHSRFFRTSAGDHLGARLQGDGSPDLPFAKNYKNVPPSAKSRNAPLGKELSEDESPLVYGQMSRDISMDSNLSVSGSMINLVKEAKEVRRLIREASMDSVASDFSLELKGSVGEGTEFHFDSLQSELMELRKNCSAINDKFENIPLIPSPSCMMTSKSLHGLSTASSELSAAEASSIRSRSRSPDPLWLKRSRVHFWKFNYNVSDHESVPTEESLEWESPMHAWHDLRKAKHKLALSSQNTSEFGGDDERSCVNSDDLDCWEWDSEGITTNHLEVDGCYPSRLMRHGKWLPENSERLELDMEAELASQLSGLGNNNCDNCTSPLSSRTNSRRGSSEWNYYANRLRLPPSGRSSVNQGSGDSPRQTIDKAQLIKSFGVYSMGENTSEAMIANITKVSCCDESGFQDGRSESTVFSVATNSSIYSTSHGLTLSPVHETKEPVSSNSGTPVKQKKYISRKIYDEESDILQLIKS